jgi:PTH1 family peptidyl-tRNA hydrolase
MSDFRQIPRMGNLHIIVGLGNPGAEYARTRHNAGFLVVNRLAGQWQSGWSYERKFEAFVARPAVGFAGDLLLCKPQTFMNASGECVGPLLTFYRVAASRCLVVVDDVDLPFGQIRVRPGGSSGGHHGLESIEGHLGTREFPRLRIGIGRQGGEREVTGHVLGKFSKAEVEILELVLARAADQAECWVREGIQKAMNQFNGAVGDPNNERSKQ